MTPVERRLRSWCRGLAMLTAGGAVVELFLVDHTGSLTQWLPFAFCAVVVVSTGVVSLRPAPAVVRLHRGLMLLVLLGAAYGVYAHLTHNMTFAREIRPSAPASAIWMAGVRGANPLLAAGALAIAAALGLMGAYGMAASGAVRA